MPEDLARRRVDDNRLRADVAEYLQETQLAGGVDLEVEAGPRHRLDVAHLAREVEDHLGRGRGLTDEPHVVDLRVDHVDRAGGVVEVAAIPAVGGHELGADRSTSRCETRQLVLDREPVRGVVDVTEQVEVAGANGPRTYVRAGGRMWERKTAADPPAAGRGAVVIEEPLPQSRRTS